MLWKASVAERRGGKPSQPPPPLRPLLVVRSWGGRMGMLVPPPCSLAAHVVVHHQLSVAKIRWLLHVQLLQCRMLGLVLGLLVDRCWCCRRFLQPPPPQLSG
jgi:hypothetical protein